MSHYITVPVNENGILFDTSMNDVVAEAMAVSPFGFRDIYIYSHGWSTDADAALDTYNKFSVQLARTALVSAEVKPSQFNDPPGSTLGVGIHWPSQITEDPNSLLNDAQLFTFYTMEHRADAVGKNAVYSMLRLMLQQRAGTGVLTRFFLIGHSFGCKVVLAALQDLQTDIAGGTIMVPPGTTFRAVLLQAATDNDNLEPTDIYGSVSQINNLRVLLTTSARDIALGKWFPLAGALANLFHGPPQALGHAGPTAATCSADAFGPAAAITIVPGFASSGLRGITDRLIVADLSPVHQQRADDGSYPGANGFAGSHSDISFEEVYQMICGFFYDQI